MIGFALVLLAALGLASAIERALELRSVRRAHRADQRHLERVQRSLDATRTGLRASDHAREVAIVERDAARRSASEAQMLLRATSTELSNLRLQLAQARGVGPSAPDGARREILEELLRGRQLLGPVLLSCDCGRCDLRWRSSKRPFCTTWGLA